MNNKKNFFLILYIILFWFCGLILFRFSETFSVDDLRTRFFVLSLGDPHSLESRQRWENRSTDPDGVFSFRWGKNLDFHSGWSSVNHLLRKSLSDTSEHSSTSRQDDVGIEVFSDIEVTLHDGFIGKLINSWEFLSNELWLEKEFWASKSLISNSNDLTIW